MDPTATIKPRILFVDDEPRILTSMRMLFRAHYELFFAESGAAAIELLKTQPVDVIVSDQRMPGMTGIELLRTARELNPNAMRILLTGYSDLNAIIGSINEGEIFRFVNKPWSNDELTATVARAVSAAKATQEVSQKPEAPVETGSSAPAILVMDDDASIPGKIQNIIGNDFRVLGASSMEDAVNLMEKERIGVVISDTRVQNHPVVTLINTLKQHRPELVSVILTERADAGQAIELINEGQIYRFLTKPLHDNQTKITLHSAQRHHKKLADNPELHQRYEVQKPKEAPAPASSSGRLLDRIRSLRSFVKRG